MSCSKPIEDFKSSNDKIIDDIENCGNIKFITSSYDSIYKNCTKENSEKCVTFSSKGDKKIKKKKNKNENK
jgi:hypothetical protein